MKKLWLVVSLVFLVPAFLVAADKYLKADPNGDLKFTVPAHIGSLILEPGTYSAHSVLKDGKHAVHMVEEKNEFHAYPQSFWLPASQHLAEIPVGTDANGGHAAETGVYFRDEGDHIVITRLVIKGEDHVHVF